MKRYIATMITLVLYTSGANAQCGGTTAQFSQFQSVQTNQVLSAGGFSNFVATPVFVPTNNVFLGAPSFSLFSGNRGFFGLSRGFGRPAFGGVRFAPGIRR